MPVDTERKILLIDDQWEEENLVSHIGNALESGRFDWAVEPVDKGQVAIDILERSPVSTFDAVLLDMEMRGQDLQGPQLLQFIKEIDPSMPVVILSSKLRAAEVQGVLHYGALFYCEKPFITQGLNPLVLREVLEATQLYPEIREFQSRLGSLGLDSEQSGEARQAIGELLQQSVDALSMHAVLEFEHSSSHIGVYSSSSKANDLRSRLLVGGAILSACQAGDAFVEELRSQVPDFEALRKEAEKTPDHFQLKADVGSRLASRTVNISALQIAERLTPWQAGALIALTWFRELVAAPFLNHGLDQLSDAAFVLDLVLSVLEDASGSESEHTRFASRSLGSHLDRLSEAWACQAEAVFADTERPDLSYIELLEKIVQELDSSPASCLKLAVRVARSIRSEIAVQLRDLGATLPGTWDPMTDGTVKALEMLRTAAMPPIRRAFPPGVWSRSEKFFRCYGHSLEWLEDGTPTPQAARLAARACMAVSSWWTRDYLPSCEKVEWISQSRPRALVLKPRGSVAHSVCTSEQTAAQEVED